MQVMRWLRSRLRRIAGSEIPTTIETTTSTTNTSIRCHCVGVSRISVPRRSTASLLTRSMRNAAVSMMGAPLGTPGSTEAIEEAIKKAA